MNFLEQLRQYENGLLVGIYKEAITCATIHNNIINNTPNILKLENKALVTFKNKHDAYEHAIDIAHTLNRYDLKYSAIKAEYDMMHPVQEKIHKDFEKCIIDTKDPHRCRGESIRTLQTYECDKIYRRIE